MSAPSIPCASCAARERVTRHRFDALPGEDRWMGLEDDGDNLAHCPACGLRYRYEIETDSYMHDYEIYEFTRLDLPVPTKKRRVCRCPECGSTSAHPDESRSRLEFTFMRCDACGKGGMYDSWQRDEEWFMTADCPVGFPVPAKVPCGLCGGDDAKEAWKASRRRQVASPLQESHFGIDLTSCVCGQIFATVFMERVAWNGGEDDQTWISVPVSDEESAQIKASPKDVEKIAGDRRFLVRHSEGVAWRDGGFAIGPHS